MNLAVYALEWRLALQRRRFFVLSVLVPLAIVAPVSAGAVGPASAVAVYAMLFVGFTVLGTAIPLRWDGERGITARVLRGGVRPWSYLLQRAAAGATLDVVQLTPALTLIYLGVGASPIEGLRLLGVLAATAWIGGLVGLMAATVSRSLPEAALVASIAAVLLGHASGIFSTPTPGSYGAFLERLAPFRALHESLSQLATAGPRSGGWAVVSWAVVLPVAVALLSSRLSASLARVGPGGLEGL